MTERIAFRAEVTSEGRSIRGSVTLAGQRTRRGGELVEVDPAAIVRADVSRVVGVWEHDPHKILGRPGNGTLALRRTDQGIEYELTDIPNTSFGNDALELVRGGYVVGSSFSIEGPFKYAFSTDPDTGERVRRITHISALTDVSPVSDPAFTASTAAAFSKEYDVSEPIVETPPTIKEDAPKATFAQVPDDKSETYRTAEAFANKQDLAGLEAAIENILTGDMTPAKAEAHDAFTKVYDERRKADTEAKDRFERMKLAQDLRLGRGPKPPAPSEQFASADYREAFSQYLRSGNQRLMEQFAQTISGDGTQGGFTVPDGFIAKIVERMKAYGGIADAADEITTTTGESLRMPYIDDTANKAVIAAEATQAASGADLVFDSIELGAFEYDATGPSGEPIEVSLSLIQDSAFDMEALLTKLLGKRIGRKQADHFATGGGGTEPVGLLTKAADTMTATVASLAAAEHILQVDSEYRNSGDARWVMSDTTLAKIWTAQSTTNEPLFLPGRTINGKPFDTVYGYPVTIDAAAANLVAFGDIKAGYLIRRVRGVQLLVDPYSTQKRRTVAYHAWARADANIQDPNAYSVSSWSGVSADT